MNFIVVVDEQYGIGYQNKLLTYLPEDLKYFKEKTLGNVVIMGRTTLEALPNGKPLPNRITIVLTRKKMYSCKGAIVVNSIEELLEILKFYENKEIFVAGGGEIYRQLIPYCKTGYVTKIQKTFEADQFLDPIDQMENWEKTWESTVKEYKELKFSFSKYEKKKEA